MKKILPKHSINYILQQLVAFTFLCIMAFLNYFINYHFLFIEISVKAFTGITIVIYEVIILYNHSKVKKSEFSTEIIESGYNERFLWFEMLLLLDILIIVAIVSQITKHYFNMIFPILIGFILFYLVTIIVKPYFGIKDHRK